MFLPFTTRQVFEALQESIKKYDQAIDKDDQCDPDAYLVIKVGNNKYNVLSYGGDPNEQGLVLEVMPFKKRK